MNLKDIQSIIDEIKYYLPHQAPLKDFVHHNSLHAFQHLNFHDALLNASKTFGYQTYLSIEEYIKLFKSNDIKQKTIDDYIQFNGLDQMIKTQLFDDKTIENHSKIGSLRLMWQKKFHININKQNHQILFKLISNYLDQGIAQWQISANENGFLDAVRKLEEDSYVSLFKTKRAKRLLLNKKTTLLDLLKIVVGDVNFYKQYLFDQQFNHSGWSGMVAFIEDHPSVLFEHRKIKLSDVIFLELLLEIDLLDEHFGLIWSPLCFNILALPVDYTSFSYYNSNKEKDILKHWQNILELENYKKYLIRILDNKSDKNLEEKSFQSVFCIDDRMCSLRRHLENLDKYCETFGAAGFFYVDIYYQPAGSKFNTKLCPGPITPTVLIKEKSKKNIKIKQDRAFHTINQTILGGWLYTNTVGYLKSFKLLNYVFNPKNSDLTNSSLDFFKKSSDLTIVNESLNDVENGLQIGFTIEQMADKAENLLKTIGLTSNFAKLVYVIGHGASSTNNTHYAGYDCGACSGRPGSVNAKIMAFICNHNAVRNLLKRRSIDIPDHTFFIAGLHDTTLDDLLFFDDYFETTHHKELHNTNINTFKNALSLNIQERAKKFDLVDGNKKQIESQVKARAFSLFEPRPELNHATNMMCVVGNRSLTYNVNLERKSFLNSYNYKTDADGKILINILNAITPVCGGINLEYFFSRVDNHRLGAGSKLPHNVVSLLGVSNGISGDLRVGLPSQMIEIHQPVRLLMLIEHHKEVVEMAIKSNPNTYEWYKNDWIKLGVIHPISKDIYLFDNGSFKNINSLLIS